MVELVYAGLLDFFLKKKKKDLLFLLNDYTIALVVHHVFRPGREPARQLKTWLELASARVDRREGEVDGVDGMSDHVLNGTLDFSGCVKVSHLNIGPYVNNFVLMVILISFLVTKFVAVVIVSYPFVSDLVTRAISVTA